MTFFPWQIQISWKLSAKILLCIGIAGTFLYADIRKRNELTLLRLMIPPLAKEVKVIHEENIRLQYAIDCFENPIHLMELARKPEFSHLKHPLTNEVITIKSAEE